MIKTANNNFYKPTGELVDNLYVRFKSKSLNEIYFTLFTNNCQ